MARQQWGELTNAFSYLTKLELVNVVSYFIFKYSKPVVLKLFFTTAPLSK